MNDEEIVERFHVLLDELCERTITDIVRALRHHLMSDPAHRKYPCGLCDFMIELGE